MLTFGGSGWCHYIRLYFSVSLYLNLFYFLFREHFSSSKQSNFRWPAVGCSSNHIWFGLWYFSRFRPGWYLKTKTSTNFNLGPYWRNPWIGLPVSCCWLRLAATSKRNSTRFAIQPKFYRIYLCFIPGLLDQPVFTVFMKHRGAAEGVNGGVFTYGAIDSTNCASQVTYVPLSSATYWQFKVCQHLGVILKTDFL